MKRLILMMIQKLVNFIDEIDIPDIEPQRYDEIQEITARAWRRAIFTPTYGLRERRVSRDVDGDYHG